MRDTADRGSARATCRSTKGSARRRASLGRPLGYLFLEKPFQLLAPAATPLLASYRAKNSGRWHDGGLPRPDRTWTRTLGSRDRARGYLRFGSTMRGLRGTLRENLTKYAAFAQRRRHDVVDSEVDRNFEPGRTKCPFGLLRGTRLESTTRTADTTCGRVLDREASSRLDS